MVLAATASSTAQSHLSVNIVEGRVSLLAQNVPLRTILQEWTRVNGTTFANIDRLAETPVSLQLTDLSQREALATLLRGVAGYVVTQGTNGPDRIVILPQSTPVNNLARTFEPAFKAPDPVEFAAATAPDAGPIAVPGREMASSDRSQRESTAAGLAGAPAAAGATSVPFVRINSSDAITEVVDGANRETMIPPALRSPTPIFMPSTTGSTPGGITTPGGPSPTGTIIFGPTDPNAIKNPVGNTPGTPAPRK